jgi:NAD+ kinase
VAHSNFSALEETFARVQAFARYGGAELLLEEQLQRQAATGAPLTTADLPRLDLLLTLGGDGTLLRGARMVAPHGVPVLGINLGYLGFLTSVAPSDVDAAFSALVDGRLVMDERMVLKASAIAADGTRRGHFFALNDAVLHKGGFARVIRLAVHADSQEVGTYRADGIILSTPTGSTAYSLSAGGPIVSPSIDCIVATPICPHTLAVRPLVLPATDKITVEVLSPSEELVLTIDGQEGAQLAPGDRLIVEKAEISLQLVRLPGQTFFDTLRRKLRWGDVAAGDR